MNASSSSSPSSSRRRSAFLSLAASLGLGLVVACATAPVDDPGITGDLRTSEVPAEPEGAKLPPPSTTSTAEPPPPAQDAGPSTPDSGALPAPDASAPPPGQTPDCDPNDPLLLLKIIISPPTESCPCSAGQCCLQGLCI